MEREPLPNSARAALIAETVKEEVERENAEAKFMPSFLPTEEDTPARARYWLERLGLPEYTWDEILVERTQSHEVRAFIITARADQPLQQWLVSRKLREFDRLVT